MFFRNQSCQIISLMGLSLFSSITFAGIMGDTTSPNPYVVTLNLGGTRASPVKTITYAIEPELTKTFTSSGGTDTLFDGEIFVGLQKELGSGLPSDLCPNVQAQYGLAIAATSSTKISGDVWDDGNPDFDNYTYSYRAQHAHLALKAKLLTDVGYGVKPYVSGSAGAGFNYLSDFNSTPTNPLAVPMPAFRSNTQTAFTYTVGLGMEVAFYDHFRAGIGYEFADWGAGHLSRGPEQLTSSGPSFNHLYTNGIMFGLSYIS